MFGNTVLGYDLKLPITADQINGEEDETFQVINTRFKFWIKYMNTVRRLKQLGATRRALKSKYRLLQSFGTTLGASWFQTSNVSRAEPM